MNWTIDTPALDSTVGMSNDLALQIIDAVDVPPGSFVLDPYADSHISPESVPLLGGNIVTALSNLKERFRAEIMKKLHVQQWPHWAEKILAAEISKSQLHAILTQLYLLTEKAMELNAGIRVFGD